MQLINGCCLIPHLRVEAADYFYLTIQNEILWGIPQWSYPYG